MGNSALGLALLRTFLAERVITVVTRTFTDVPILVILAWDSSINGIVAAFVVVTPIYLFLCIGIVIISDMACKRGVDLTGLETLRELEHAVLEKRQWFKRILRRMLRSRNLIFWIGSWFLLDPDYVALLLRKREEGYVSTFLRIILPSVMLSMVVWLGVWWAAVQGYRWALWMLKWIL